MKSYLSVDGTADTLLGLVAIQFFAAADREEYLSI
jgi:hypothetical protein